MKYEPQYLDECSPCLAKANEPFPLSVVIVYNDMYAALRAAQAVERLAKKFAGTMLQKLLPVPLRQLGDPGCFDHSLSDASSADMIVVSYNGPGEFPATLKKWVENCLGQKREGDSAVVALLGSHEETDAPDSPRLQFLRRAARAAGLDFFAPESRRQDPLMSTLEVVG